MRLSILSTGHKYLAALLLLAGVCQLAYADSSYDAEGKRRAQNAGASLIGQPGPVAILKTVDGEEIDLSQYYGKKPVYLKFWATWCVPCLQQMPGFEKTQQALGAPSVTLVVRLINFNRTDKTECNNGLLQHRL